MIKGYDKMTNRDLLEILYMKMNEGGLSMDQRDACLYFESILLSGERLSDDEINELRKM